MDEHQLRQLKPELDRFLGHYLPRFGLPANHAHARVFVQGLLRGGERRNVENLAEAMYGSPSVTILIESNPMNTVGKLDSFTRPGCVRRRARLVVGQPILRGLAQTTITLRG